MENHHQEAIEKFVGLYQSDPTILAILLSGSIAHGFARSDSDVDVTLIVTEDEYQRRKRENRLAFSRWDICTYAGGYIDCKMVSTGFLRLLAGKGSDPARYAYLDNVILFSRIDDLADLLQDVSRFPLREKDGRKRRFAAQLLAWKWYYSEAVKKQNPYLTYLAVQKIVLFACRLVLNENQMLYPYHKWLLNVTRSAQSKPTGFDCALEEVMAHPTLESVNPLCDGMMQFVGLEEKSLDWPNHFLLDSELNWLEHEAPIDDL